MANGIDDGFKKPGGSGARASFFGRRKKNIPSWALKTDLWYLSPIPSRFNRAPEQRISQFT
jgi:hypothetical protein